MANAQERWEETAEVCYWETTHIYRPDDFLHATVSFTEEQNIFTLLVSTVKAKDCM